MLIDFGLNRYEFEDKEGRNFFHRATERRSPLCESAVCEWSAPLLIPTVLVCDWSIQNDASRDQ